MNKVERLQNAIKGEEVDTIPYGFWTHFPGIDLDPDRLAENSYNFYKKYDIDFIKMMSNGMYATEGYGCSCDFSEINKGGVAKIVGTPVKTYEDWASIEPISIEKGALKRELISLEKLLSLVKGEAPILFTIFSPLTTAQKLSNGKILSHIRQGETTLIHHALDAIAKTTALLTQRAIEMGASGVFLATQLCRSDVMNEKEYVEFGKPYDEKVLKAAEKGWCNTLHIHGENIMFDLVKDYPVDILNWHVWETDPDIKTAREKSNKCFMGGINRFSITEQNKEAIHTQIETALAHSKRKKHILSPGCVIRYPLCEEIFKYVAEVRDAVNSSYVM